MRATSVVGFVLKLSRIGAMSYASRVSTSAKILIPSHVIRTHIDLLKDLFDRLGRHVDRGQESVPDESDELGVREYGAVVLLVEEGLDLMSVRAHELVIQVQEQK